MTKLFNATIAILVISAVVSSQCATADLIGHWTFDDDPAGDSAVLADISGSANVHNGTLNTTLANAAVAGQIGGAFDFTDSGDDFVIADLGTDFVTGSSPASISFWMNPDDISGQAFAFAWGNNSTGQNVRVSVEDNAGSTELRYRHQGGYVGFDASAMTEDSGWHHVAAVVPDGATTVGDVLFYLDGELMDIVTPDNDNLNVTAGTGGTNLFIGSNWNGATAFNGQIDDVGWWNEAISAEDIETIYSAGLQGRNLQEAFQTSIVPEPFSLAIWSIFGFAMASFMMCKRLSRKRGCRS